MSSILDSEDLLKEAYKLLFSRAQISPYIRNAEGYSGHCRKATDVAIGTIDAISDSYSSLGKLLDRDLIGIATMFHDWGYVLGTDLGHEIAGARAIQTSGDVLGISDYLRDSIAKMIISHWCIHEQYMDERYSLANVFPDVKPGELKPRFLEQMIVSDADLRVTGDGTFEGAIKDAKERHAGDYGGLYVESLEAAEPRLRRLYDTMQALKTGVFHGEVELMDNIVLTL